jgi:pantoate--beta-alanine ligase
MTPLVARTRDEIREALGNDAPGLVPTMGALHAGHVALIRRSVAENERTVVSVFVNPAQFSDPADLAAYPRKFDDDLAVAAEAGAGLVFAPSVEEMYPPGFATAVEVGDLSRRWEGAARPGHFRGVATVVAILLGLIRPAHAYFGEKDYQQLQIVRRMHADLALPGAIVGCPTVRDADGLALSSRNSRLSPANRAVAAALPRALAAMANQARTGCLDVVRLEAVGREILAGAPSIAVDYLAIVDGRTLEPLIQAAPGSRAIAAITIGGVRLIDNVELLGEAGEP